MKKEKIVVVDDDPEMIRNLELVLNEYDVVGYTEPLKALDFFLCPNDAALAIVDVVMPEMSGITLLQKIKEKNKELPVIIITAYSSKDIAITALRNHADDFIEKPFNAAEFKEKVLKVLKENPLSDPLFPNKLDNVDRIKQFIERNYKNASLALIAEELCLSPKYISRMFNEKSEAGFRDYKLHIKIDRAKELLEKSTLNINEISRQLGYQNPESFMRIFKRVTSLTPKHYRKSCRETSKK